MAFTFSTGARKRAQKVLVYGPEGVGKSTFAAQFPDPLFIDAEESTWHLDVRRFDPAPRSWPQLLEMVEYCAGSGLTPGSTLVVDTLDWAEALCAEHVCARDGKPSIESYGYAKGYKVASEEFKKLLDGLTKVVDKGANAVCTAHAKVSKFEQPDEMGSYDRWGLKLIDAKNASDAALVKEWADAVLFANFKSEVITTDEGKRKARGSKRVMYAEHDACWDAKNRWGLPPSCDFDYAAISEHIPGKPRSDASELARLIAGSGATDEEVRRAVHSVIPTQPYEDPVSGYPPELVTRLVVGWPGVMATIEKLRSQDAEGIPFI